MRWRGEQRRRSAVPAQLLALAALVGLCLSAAMCSAQAPEQQGDDLWAPYESSFPSMDEEDEVDNLSQSVDEDHLVSGADCARGQDDGTSRYCPFQSELSKSSMKASRHPSVAAAAALLLPPQAPPAPEFEFPIAQGRRSACLRAPTACQRQPPGRFVAVRGHAPTQPLTPA